MIEKNEKNLGIDATFVWNVLQEYELLSPWTPEISNDSTGEVKAYKRKNTRNNTYSQVWQHLNGKWSGLVDGRWCGKDNKFDDEVAAMEWCDAKIVHHDLAHIHHRMILLAGPSPSEIRELYKGEETITQPDDSPVKV